jgi:hypothetical protein
MGKFSVAPASAISQPVRHLASMAAHGGQIVGPCVSILALSGTQAFGMHQGLVRGPNERLTSEEAAAVRAPSTVTSTTALRMPDEPNVTWMILSSVDREAASMRVTCIVRPDLFAADSLELDPSEMDRLAAQLRYYSQAPQ